MTLDILRGIQGIGAAAMIPASVCLLSLEYHISHCEIGFDN